MSIFSDPAESAAQLSKQVSSLSNELNNLKQGFNKIESSALGVSRSIENMSSIVTGFFLVNDKLIQISDQYSVSIDKLSRSTITYATNAEQLDRKLTKLAKTTGISKQDLLEMNKSIDRSFVGTRNYAGLDRLIERLAMVNKTSQETKAALQEVLSIQQRFGTTSLSNLTPTEITSLDRDQYRAALDLQFSQTRSQKEVQDVYGTRFGERSRERQSIIGRHETNLLEIGGMGQDYGFQPIASRISESFSGIGQTLSVIGGMANFATQIAGLGSLAKKGTDLMGWTKATDTMGGISGGLAPKNGGIPVWIMNPAFNKGKDALPTPPSDTPSPTDIADKLPEGKNFKEMASAAWGGFKNFAGTKIGKATIAGVAGTLATPVIDLGLEAMGASKQTREKASTISSYATTGAMIGSFLPGGPLLGAAIGGLAGVGMNMYQDYKKEQEAQAALKTYKIQSDIQKVLLERNVDEKKLNDLVVKYNSELDDGEQKLNAELMLKQKIFDQYKADEIAVRRVNDILSERTRIQSDILSFYTENGVVSLAGAAAKQLVEDQKAQYNVEINLIKQKRKFLEDNGNDATRINNDLIKAQIELSEATKEGDSERQLEIKKTIDALEAEEASMKRAAEATGLTQAELIRADVTKDNLRIQESGLKLNNQQVTAVNEELKARRAVQDVNTRIAETTERISQTARLGVGPEYSAIVNTAQQYANEVQLAQEAYANLNQELIRYENKQIQIEKELKKENLTHQKKVDLQRQQTEIQATIESIQLKMNNENSKSLEKQSQMMEKLLSLREKYIEALPEFSAAGFNVEFNPTMSSGLSLFGRDGGSMFYGGRLGGGNRNVSGGFSPSGAAGGWGDEVLGRAFKGDARNIGISGFPSPIAQSEMTVGYGTKRSGNMPEIPVLNPKKAFATGGIVGGIQRFEGGGVAGAHAQAAIAQQYAMLNKNKKTFGLSGNASENPPLGGGMINPDKQNINAASYARRKNKEDYKNWMSSLPDETQYRWKHLKKRKEQEVFEERQARSLGVDLDILFPKRNKISRDVFDNIFPYDRKYGWDILLDNVWDDKEKYVPMKSYADGVKISPANGKAVPAIVHEGELILNPSQQRALGLSSDVLRGIVPGFASGGYVGGKSPAIAGGGGTSVSVNYVCEKCRKKEIVSTTESSLNLSSKNDLANNYQSSNIM